MLWIITSVGFFIDCFKDMFWKIKNMWQLISLWQIHVEMWNHSYHTPCRFFVFNLLIVFITSCYCWKVKTTLLIRYMYLPEPYTLTRNIGQKHFQCLLDLYCIYYSHLAWYTVLIFLLLCMKAQKKPGSTTLIFLSVLL